MRKNQKQQTCCFTGHRVIPPEILPALTTELEAALHALIQQGFRYFGAGGALGFDTLAAETVLRLKAEYPHIRLILVLPCKDQTKGWPLKDVQRFQSLLGRADKVVYTAGLYQPGCMHRRNRHLVDNSAVCLAYCARSSGGSAYTLNYARKQGLAVVQLAGSSLHSP